MVVGGLGDRIDIPGRKGVRLGERGREEGVGMECYDVCLLLCVFSVDPTVHDIN